MSVPIDISIIVRRNIQRDCAGIQIDAHDEWRIEWVELRALSTWHAHFEQIARTKVLDGDNRAKLRPIDQGDTTSHKIDLVHLVVIGLRELIASRENRFVGQRLRGITIVDAGDATDKPLAGGAQHLELIRPRPALIAQRTQRADRIRRFAVRMHDDVAAHPVRPPELTEPDTRL